MPCSYKIYKDRRLVVSTAWEQFTFADGMAHEDRIYLDPEFDPTYAHLIDATQVTTTDISGSELATLARRTKISPKARRAFVAPTVVIYGLARMFETYLQLAGSGEFMAVFREMKPAMDWLGVEGEP